MIKCQFENGDYTSLRHLCVNTIVVKDNQVLLGKRGTFQGKKIPEYGKWGLIGGYLDRDETLIEGMQRELMEESGWKVDEIVLFAINDLADRPMEDKQNVNVIFVAHALERIGESDEEVLELKWFDFDKLPGDEEIAFDHEKHLRLYKQHIINHLNLPVIYGAKEFLFKQN